MSSTKDNRQRRTAFSLLQQSLVMSSQDCFYHNTFLSCPRILLLVLFSLCILFSSQNIYAEDPTPEEQHEEALLAAERLRDKALEKIEEGDEEAAVGLFYRLYRNYPTSPHAEDSLWQVVRYYKDEALTTRQGWERVRELSKAFASEFSDSSHSPDAYFNMGVALFHMGLYREADVRFKLFFKRFPDFQLSVEASCLYAKYLMETKRYDDADKIFQKLAGSEDVTTKKRGMFGLFEVLVERGKNVAAIKYYKGPLGEFPLFYVDYPEVVLLLGRVYSRLGDEEHGREKLMHYLNLLDKPSERGEALFELGESYYRKGNDFAAQKFYLKVIDECEDDMRSVAMSRFRVAQFLDDPEKKATKWQRKGDLTDSSEDAPYLVLLERYANEPIAQEARYGLFLRYQAREDFLKALDVGKRYLKSASPEKTKSGEQSAAGNILLYCFQEFMKKKEFKDAYRLMTEYGHIEKYPDGQLLYLTGQALEGLYLYDQAAVVYYRALRLSLSDEDKTDLYLRRANLYLTMKDFVSADRLLKHLYKIYRDKKIFGEICFLSGRLSEAQGNMKKASAFYSQAAELLTFPEKKNIYGESLLRALFSIKQHEAAAETLQTYKKEKWLDEDALQRWFGMLGDSYFERQELSKALLAYQVALAEDMPQEGKQSQKIRMHMGDVYCAEKKWEKCFDSLKMVKAGDDPVLQQLAEERLRQVEIDRTMSAIHAKD